MPVDEVIIVPEPCSGIEYALKSLASVAGILAVGVVPIKAVVVVVEEEVVVTEVEDIFGVTVDKADPFGRTSSRSVLSAI